MILAACALSAAASLALAAPGTINLDALSDAEIEGLTLRLERTRCYGTCPAYAVAIHGNGQVDYTGADHVKLVGAASGRMERSAIRRVLSALSRLEFLSIGEQYTPRQCSCRVCTDMPTAIIGLTIGTFSHRVEHYHGCGCAPKGLFEVESMIDSEVGIENWIGDVREQGPFGTTCVG